jgi:hypothetical protein
MPIIEEEPENDDEVEESNQVVDYARLKRINNPDNKPTGHFTGRCDRCGSDNLWDDSPHYGCNDCGAFLA